MHGVRLIYLRSKRKILICIVQVVTCVVRQNVRNEHNLCTLLYIYIYIYYRRKGVSERECEVRERKKGDTMF